MNTDNLISPPFSHDPNFNKVRCLRSLPGRSLFSWKKGKWGQGTAGSAFHSAMKTAPLSPLPGCLGASHQIRLLMTRDPKTRPLWAGQRLAPVILRPHYPLLERLCGFITHMHKHSLGARCSWGAHLSASHYYRNVLGNVMFWEEFWCVCDASSTFRATVGLESGVWLSFSHLKH